MSQTLRYQDRRKCSLCLEDDNIWHVLGSCKFSENYKKEFGVNITPWEWKKVKVCVKVKDEQSLEKLGPYLSKVRKKELKLKDIGK